MVRRITTCPHPALGSHLCPCLVSIYFISCLNCLKVAREDLAWPGAGGSCSENQMTNGVDSPPRPEREISALISGNISPKQILKSQKHCSFDERTRSALILWKMDFGDFPFSIITNLHIKYLNFLIVWKCRLQKFIFGFFPDYFRFICPCCSKFQFSPGSLSKVIFYSQWRSLCLSASEALFSLSDPHKRNGNHSSRDGKWPFRGQKAGGERTADWAAKLFLNNTMIVKLRANSEKSKVKTRPWDRVCNGLAHPPPCKLLIKVR